ncbi:MAG: caspase family protein [Nodosilinea sp.]
MNSSCLTPARRATAIALVGTLVALGTQIHAPEEAIANDRGTVIIEERPHQSTGRRVALVIGNANYRTLGPLNNSANDAADMARILDSLGFEVIAAIDADLQTMQRRLQEFRAAIREGSVGLFYFAGHGVQYQGKNYLIPVDAPLQDVNDLDLYALPLNAVLDRMRDANSAANIIILDACRNNPFPGGDRSAQRGLATVQAARGFYIAYATRPGHVASDGTGRNGTYTNALLRHIGTPGVSIEQMFKQVRNDVDQATGGQQLPWDESSLIGDFAFNSGQFAPANAPNFTDQPAVVPPSFTPSFTNDIICGASICEY